ncbi:N-acyl-D-amino-acid deacylase family protein [Cupriavidus taiwanensis]|uniref:N-acyl-D-amino-acid deacylase family protein n=1 Tax=Cupriavidus taiwanensis TaxID=164546 RepID=UPI000E106D27|nr:D-aminoacylase [Cupriavidus taiwanensis]SPA56955.1 N-acyl-D-aspartate deacylase (N-acyl-D-aspartate amidohydrolase) [Cupriavidus taiwanensis]
MASQSPAPRRADLLFRNATVVDGTGAARRSADVAVSGDRIVAVGDCAGIAADHTVDAGGRVLAPGFIDAHTHDDGYLLVHRDMTPKVSQGITTVVTGNCGISVAPLLSGAPPQPLDLLGPPALFRFDTFAQWLDALRAAPANVNVVPLLGHSTLRVRAMPELDRPANDAEIAAMREEVRLAMEAGAFGVSTGTFYPPAAAATEAEIIAVCEPVRTHRGLYSTHLRDETDAIVPSIEEALRIGRALDCPVVFSHHKVAGKRNHGRSAETLGLLAEAARLQPLCLDCHPYPATSTMLRLDRVRQSTRTLITWSTGYPAAGGRDFHELMQELGLDEEALLARLRPAAAIYFIMDERDVARIAQFPLTMFGSDGLPFDPRPHPRQWGTFPRILARMVREEQLLTLEAAIHKMSGLAAQQYGLQDRGRIAPGAFADLVLFDAQRVQDRATFEDPLQLSTGIDGVWVNGAQVWQQGAQAGDAAGSARPAFSGRVLRRLATEHTATTTPS